MDTKNLQALISLYYCHGIGREILKSLLPYFNALPLALMEAEDSELYAIEGVRKKLVEKLRSAPANLAAAAREIAFMEQNGIRMITFFDADYPYRLKRCEDAPLFLFCKGSPDLNPRHALAIVGTRRATEQGRAVCQQMIGELAAYRPLIVSGMASGIDITAHKSALYARLPTVGVLGHGLDTLYPAQHKTIAQNMLEQQGGLLSEYRSQTRPDKGNFPERNRIIAGLCDAVIVIEAAEKGGAHITAELASDYHREVFAVPGRPADEFSRGCNRLIRENKASLVENAADVARFMGWEQAQTPAGIQRKLLPELSAEETRVAELLLRKEQWHIDELMANTAFSPAKLSGLLLSMEMQGLVRSLPGKRYRII